MRRVLVPALALVLVLLPAAPSGADSCHASARAAGARVQPARVRVVDADAQGRVLVDVSWRRSEGADPGASFHVTVNGSDVAWDQVGAGSGGGREEATLAIAPARYGRLAIEVTVEVGDRRLRGRASTRFQPEPAVLPDWADSELLLGARALRFGFRHTRLVEVRLNGEPAAHGIEKDVPRDHTTYHAAILEERFRPGANLLEIVHVDYRGETRTVRSSIHWAPGGEVATGAEFALTYGVVGSRSGPFFRVAAPSEILIELADIELPDGRLVKRYRATGPGRGAIVLEKKAHFRGSWEVERTIPIRVVP